MRRNGSIYVSLVVALLAGYFTYQWWYNPRRVIKRQLGELAAALSVPEEGEGDVDRLARVARLRNYFAPDVRLTLGTSGREITSRDELLAAVRGWRPSPGGVTVAFVDVQIALDSSDSARAYMTVELTTRDAPDTQPAFDAREVTVGLAPVEGAWVITTAEPAETLRRP
jgi:hypothetical protein